MKILDKNICLTSRRSIMVIISLLVSTIVIASVITNTEKSPTPKIPTTNSQDEDIWYPTKEDIAYQDSMFLIVERTQQDVDTIKDAIDDILVKMERLEFSDGIVDSIKYVKGGKIDKKRN